jgi:hypothetical protein
MTKIQQLGFKDYDDYLSSDRWANRRLAFKANYPERCFVCNTTSCCLHHVTYARVGNEEDADLVWLCRHHHEQIHAVQGGKATIPTPNAHLRMRDDYLNGKTYRVIKSFKDETRRKKQALKAQGIDLPTTKQVKRLRELGATDAEIAKTNRLEANHLLNQLQKVVSNKSVRVAPKEQRRASKKKRKAKKDDKAKALTINKLVDRFGCELSPLLGMTLDQLNSKLNGHIGAQIQSKRSEVFSEQMPEIQKSSTRKQQNNEQRRSRETRRREEAVKNKRIRDLVTGKAPGVISVVKSGIFVKIVTEEVEIPDRWVMDD